MLQCVAVCYSVSPCSAVRSRLLPLFHAIHFISFYLFFSFYLLYFICMHTASPRIRIWRCMNSRRLPLTGSFHSCHLISSLFISYPLHAYNIFAHTHPMLRCCTNSSLHPLFPSIHGISFCLFLFYVLHFVCIQTTSSRTHFTCYGAAQIRKFSNFLPLLLPIIFHIHPHAYIIFLPTHHALGEVGGWGRDPKKCTGRGWGMGSSTI